jgi:hypothetical protein
VAGADTPLWGRLFGRLHGAEAGHAVAHQAFAHGVSEVFAVVRLGNTRGVATARRVEMEWVGETDKYYGLMLQIYYPEPTRGTDTNSHRIPPLCCRVLQVRIRALT